MVILKQRIKHDLSVFVRGLSPSNYFDGKSNNGVWISLSRALDISKLVKNAITSTK